MDVLKELTKRKERLERIANSMRPNNKELIEGHEKRVSVAKAYLSEINSLISIFSGAESKTICIVPINIFEKKLKNADFATIEDEGCYFRMAHVINYPFEGYTLLYLFPLSSI